MTVQHTFQAPNGVTIYACDDFPSCWDIVLYRSQDGTPVIEVLTADVSRDHDAAGSPFARFYLNDAVTYEHTSAAAPMARDERGAPCPVFLHRPPHPAAAPEPDTVVALATT